MKKMLLFVTIFVAISLNVNADANDDLWDAVNNGDTELVKLIVENGSGVDVNKKMNGTTILMKYIKDKNLSMIKYMIEHGADVNLKSNNGWSPLTLAAYIMDFEVSSYLVDHKAEITNRARIFSSGAVKIYFDEIFKNRLRDKYRKH